MAFGDYISRDEAAALIPEDVSREIIKGTTEKSAALQLFTHRTMSRHQQRMPVLSFLPTAYFVQGDTGLKQHTEAKWQSKFLNAEEIAVIVPIPEALLDDVDYDVWEEIRPLLEEAVAVALDDAIFFGVNKPASWPTDIRAAATAAGNVVTAGTSSVDVAEDINQVMRSVEEDGYEVTGFWIRPQFRATLRGLRDANKGFLFDPAGPANTGAARAENMVGTIYGVRTFVTRSGLTGFQTGASNCELICGDWSEGIIGIRQDLTFKMLDQAVLQDAAGNIVFNLAQQDMVAMRVVARFAWQVPNPVNRLQQTEASRYPFGVLLQA